MILWAFYRQGSNFEALASATVEIDARMPINVTMRSDFLGARMCPYAPSSSHFFPAGFDCIPGFRAGEAVYVALYGEVSAAAPSHSDRPYYYKLRPRRSRALVPLKLLGF